MAVELFVVPYDDRDGERDENLPSIRSVASQMNTTILRVRKLLITAGYFSTEQSREVQRRVQEGQSTERIIEGMNLKRASVYSYLPYKDIAYNLPETTVNADRHKLFRQRRRAVKMLQDNADSPDIESYLWEAIVHFAGYPFKTAKGLKFYYSIKTGRHGEPVGEIVFNRKAKIITRATINLAYKRALEVQKEEGCVSGPKKLGVFGASYIYPIFGFMGIPNREPRCCTSSQAGEIRLCDRQTSEGNCCQSDREAQKMGRNYLAGRSWRNQPWMVTELETF